MVNGSSILNCTGCNFNLSDQSLAGDAITVADGGSSNTQSGVIETVNSASQAVLSFTWAGSGSSHDTVTISGQKLLYSASAHFNAADQGGTITSLAVPAGTTVSAVDNANIVNLNNQPTATTANATVAIGGSKDLIDNVATFTLGEVGQAITGSGIPTGTTVATFVNSHEITLSNQPTLTQNGVGTWAIPGTTLLSATAQFTAGDVGASVSGGDVAGGSVITAVSSDGKSATLSAAATADGTGESITINRGTELGVVGECTEFGVPLGSPCDSFVGGNYASDGNTVTHNTLSGNSIGILANGPGFALAWSGPTFANLNAAWYSEASGNQFGTSSPPPNLWSGNSIAEAVDGTTTGFNVPGPLNTWDASNAGNSGFAPCNPTQADNGSASGFC
jgi:hypothetical protein